MIEIPEIVIPARGHRRRRAAATDAIAPEGAAHEDVAAPVGFVAPREDEIQIGPAPTSPERMTTAQDSVHQEPDANEPDSDADDAFQLREPMTGAPDFRATQTPRLDTGLDRRAAADSFVHEEPDVEPDYDEDDFAPQSNTIEKGRAEDFVVGAHPAILDQGDPEREEAMRQRRRRLAITGAVAGLGAIAEAAGGARGMGGLAGLGGALMAAPAFVDPNAPIKELEAERARKEHEQALQTSEEQRALSNEARNRSLTLQEQNAMSGQTNAEANRRMRELEQMRISQTFDAEHNPDSPAAANARQRFAAQVRQYEDAGIGSASDWQDVLDSLPTVGANEIERNIEDVSNSIRTRLRRRGGGGGGSGHGGASGIASDEPETFQTLVERGMMNHPEYSRQRAESLVRTMLSGDSASTRSAAGAMLGIGTISNEHGDIILQGEASVPGWEPDPNNPVRLSPAEVRTARQANGLRAQAADEVARMLRLIDETTAADRAGNAAGIVTQNIARAQSLQRSLSAALRNIYDFGVPTGDEMQRIEQEIPNITTLDGLINARTKYRALVERMNRGFQVKFQAEYGLRRVRPR